MKPETLALSLALLLVAAACGPASKKVVMNEDNNSGQIGTALLTEEPDGMRVEITLDKGNATGAELGHIHNGRCGSLGSASVPLTKIEDGKSISTGLKNPQNGEPLTFSDLLAAPFAINIHSADDARVYVSCGNIQ